jgi:hypothetical protein
VDRNWALANSSCLVSHNTATTTLNTTLATALATCTPGPTITKQHVVWWVLILLGSHQGQCPMLWSPSQHDSTPGPASPFS